MPPHTAREVLGVALRLGLTSFGGPIAHIGYYRREYVERRRWLDEPEFADLVALAQSLPGPASSQLQIAIGTRRAGLAGGLAAWLGFTLPSAVLMLGFGLLATRVDVSTAGWVHGLKVVAVAVVAQAVFQMARSLAPDLVRRLLALAAMAVALLLATPFTQLAVIAAGAVAGLLVLRPGPQPAPAGSQPTPREPQAPSAPAGPQRPAGVPWRAGAVALGLFVVLLVGLPLLAAAGSDVARMADAYYGSGALVFGGGHVVLPMLQARVVDPGWVTDSAFVAGYGAAQAVPGPLFTFAAFLGAVSTQAPNGVAGGLIALVAIFLPGFLLVLGVLPMWDWLRASTVFRRALLGVNAVVVGLLAAALYTPVWTSAISGPFDIALAAVCLALLATRRLPPIGVVALAAAASQAASMILPGA